ncbi:hypothetical protein GCM10010358_07110 [Streptomyces minutiscleroticus]|uniref:arginine--tRNA ligase n=1 Tax=Streptomyces minutiscleroticus TaxID=68238 RepID=A0A918NBA6_9ACTN|nr:DALR anticodon-binding domain-containing protein [Streptomyces minutiscleroticus]GGX55826.1 hypothetical protein GCM10010358_07110 [Streptomyces minutiscleroticus]
MTPGQLSRTVIGAVRRAVDVGELRVAVPERAVVTPPGAGGRGDYATTIALQLAKPAGRPPRQVAEILRPYLTAADEVVDVEITGPGFLNIHLAPEAVAAGPAALVADILDRRQGDVPYGHGDALSGEIVQLRVSYEVRAEVVADAVARLVAAQGGRAEVTHSRPGEPVTVRPVPAPEDPAPLGPDAARWALLYPAAHDRPRITAEHLAQRESNPLFRVRYAHARVRALLRNAAHLGFTADAHAEAPHPTQPGRPDRAEGPAGPAYPPEAAPLLAALADHPRVLASAAVAQAPDRVARQLVGIADGLLAFQHTVLPRGGEKPSAAHRARLALAEAAGAVLAGGLSLLGIDAPEHL